MQKQALVIAQLVMWVKRKEYFTFFRAILNWNLFIIEFFYLIKQFYFLPFFLHGVLEFAGNPNGKSKHWAIINSQAINCWLLFFYRHNSGVLLSFSNINKKIFCKVWWKKIKLFKVKTEPLIKHLIMIFSKINKFKLWGRLYFILNITK